MFITVETDYKKRFEDESHSAETGELLFPSVIFHSDCLDRVKTIDAGIKCAVVELTRKIANAEAFISAVEDYTSAIEYYNAHENEPFAKDRLYNAEVHLCAILKDYELSR